MKDLKRKVLDCLSQDARMSLEDMAILCQSQPKDIASALESLTKDKVLLKCVPVVDDTKISDLAPIRALVELSISPQQSTGYEAIGARIAQFPNVKDQYLLSGQYDFLVIIEGSNHHDIATFVYEKLATLEGVTNTSTHFVFKRYKKAGVLIHEDTPLPRQVISA